MTKKRNKGGGGGAAEDVGGDVSPDVVQAEPIRMEHVPSTATAIKQAASNRRLDGFQNDVIHRSTVAQHGWWHTEDFKIHHVISRCVAYTIFLKYSASLI